MLLLIFDQLAFPITLCFYVEGIEKMSDQSQQQFYGQNPSVQTQQPPVNGQLQYGGPNYIPPPPKKKGIFSKKRTWFFIVALVIVIGVITSVNKGGSTSSTDTTSTSGTSSSTDSSAQPTTPPTKAMVWTTTQTITGNGTKKTAVFHVGNDWKIVWSCDPSSFATQYNVIVMVNNSDGTYADPSAINTLCKTGNTGDSTEEHQGGDVYLDITSEGAWKIQVQELK